MFFINYILIVINKLSLQINKVVHLNFLVGFGLKLITIEKVFLKKIFI